MPIFVAREWIRHRTANVNEYSLRYSQAKGEFFELESVDQVRMQSTTNKQGSDLARDPAQNLDNHLQEFVNDVRDMGCTAMGCYTAAIEAGVARE
jgi:thymidylate synthase ThyX